MKLFQSFFSPLPTGEGSGVRLLLLASLFLASCSQTEGLPEGEAVEIRLSGNIGSPTASVGTRAVVDQAFYTANALSVNFLRIDQNTDGSWPAYTTVASPLAATRVAGAESAAINFTTPQYYLVGTANNSTKLIGWYPATATYTQAEGKVTFDISGGTTDVMLTNEVTGSKDSKFGTAGKTFTFNHLLTQVTVKAFASVDETASKWGKVTSIKVKDQPTECIVTLPTQAPAWGATTQNLLLKNPADDADMGEIDLNGKTTAGNAATCGYAMLKPTADENLTLEVITEKGGTRDVTVTLPDAADPKLFAAGTAYTVTLNFKSTIVEPTATISTWKTGSDISVDL